MALRSGDSLQNSPNSGKLPAIYVTSDSLMKQVFHRAVRVAASNASVLITGETGTGKEVMARYIHENSDRAKGPFVAVNCAAIPDHLLESELFGHERGSFSGAVRQRIGKIEASHRGTLLLDEVSEMDYGLQAKLLRAIQEREIDRVGGMHPIPVDVRIIATTNRDVVGEVEAARFRKDLYFRLAVVCLHMPSLREHPNDIIPLAEHFVSRLNAGAVNPSKFLSEKTKQSLLDYDWPGNIRELENTIHRAFVMSSTDMIFEDDLEIGTQQISTNTSPESEKRQLNRGFHPRQLLDIERDAIINTLISAGGNRSRTSQILGMSIRTLRNKLKSYAAQGLQLPLGGPGQTSR